MATDSSDFESDSYDEYDNPIPDSDDPNELVAWWVAYQAALARQLYRDSFVDGIANFNDQFPDLAVTDFDSVSVDDRYEASVMDAHMTSIAKMGGELTGLIIGGLVKDALGNWITGAIGRVGKMAETLVWAAEQHGYKVAGDGKGLEIEWELDEGAEHCDDCPDLADGGPYTDDNGDNPLPTTPGAGDTTCGPNCACSLNYHEAGDSGDDSGDEPDNTDEE